MVCMDLEYIVEGIQPCSIVLFIAVHFSTLNVA